MSDMTRNGDDTRSPRTKPPAEAPERRAGRAPSHGGQQSPEARSAGRDSNPGRPRQRQQGPNRADPRVQRPRYDRAGTGRERPPKERVDAPPIPDDVLAGELDRAARGRLRTLSKDNADGVARHLVMAGRLLDDNPEDAYRHAQAAVQRAGRVDVVREAAAITAYRTGRYAEALRELRTVRRLNGSDEHLPLMADCERGLGRPERAIALAQEESARDLPAETRAELAIVVSGARLDLGEPEAAVAVLRGITGRVSVEQADRVRSALADALEAAGKTAEAAQLRAGLAPEDEEIIVHDLEELTPDADDHPDTDSRRDDEKSES